MIKNILKKIVAEKEKRIKGKLEEKEEKNKSEKAIWKRLLPREDFD